MTTMEPGLIHRMPVESHSLVNKLAAIMAEPSVGKVPKNGTNTHFGYKFVQEEDVSDALRDRLAAAKIMVFPSVINERREGTLTILNVAVTFVDGESGERETVNAVGYGADTQDKGANKALTAAVKYALIKTFLIASGEDADAGHGEAQTVQAATRPRNVAPPAPRAAQKPAAAPQKAPEPAGEVQEIATPISGVTLKKGPLKAGKPEWTKYTITDIEGTSYGTFSETYAKTAKAAAESGATVLIRYKTGKYGNDIEREDGLALIEPGGEVPQSNEVPF